MYRTHDDLCTMAYADMDRPSKALLSICTYMSLTAWHSYIIILCFEFGYQFIASGTETLRCVSWDFSLQKWTTQGCMTSTGSDRVTVVSRVSAHGRLNITRDFGPHGRLPGI